MKIPIISSIFSCNHSTFYTSTTNSSARSATHKPTIPREFQRDISLFSLYLRRSSSLNPNLIASAYNIAYNLHTHTRTISIAERVFPLTQAPPAATFSDPRASGKEIAARRSQLCADKSLQAVSFSPRIYRFYEVRARTRAMALYRRRRRRRRVTKKLCAMCVSLRVRYLGC